MATTLYRHSVSKRKTSTKMYTMSTTTVLLLFLIPVLFPSYSVASVGLPAGRVGNVEVLGLAVFRSSLVDPNAALSKWNAEDDTPCSWPHVRCDAATSRVVGLSLDSLSLSGPPIFRGLDRLGSLESLSLSNNSLSGSLAPGLSLLPRLKFLDMSKNSLSGRLPDDLGNLTSLLSLNLSDNSLSGPIPDSLFSAATCSSLQYLSLGGNRLEGPIPSTLSQCTFLLSLNLSNNKLSSSQDFANGVWSISSLRVLDMSNNAFSGPVSEKVAQLHDLRSFYLNGNRFSGQIPSGIGLCTHLNSVNLGDNDFDGAIPDTMQSLFDLSFLSLSKNKLTGDVPAWIGSLGTLQHLDLSGNKLTGEVPESLGGLKDLKYLSLSNNLLTGEIPAASLSKCTKLCELRLNKNGLNGSIPHSLSDLGLEVLDMSSNKLTGSLRCGSGKLSQTLRSLDLSSNGLTGAIPTEMSLFFNLRYLNLSWNNLRSQLPPELGSLKGLSVLDLRRNEFSGRIPGDLCKFGSLAILQLDGNFLTGSIPKEIGNCSSLYLLSLSRNALSGTIPASMSMLKKLEILNLEFNCLSGEIPQQLGTLTNLLAVNMSHNQLVGRLPKGGIFQSLDQSALQGNLGICSPHVTGPCKMNVPKPLVLDPNEFNGNNGDGIVAPPGPGNSRHQRSVGLPTIVAIAASSAIALGVVVAILLSVSARRRHGLLENSLESICSDSTISRSFVDGKAVLFRPRSGLRAEDLVSAESMLSKAVEIGRGTLGIVYKSSIGEAGRIVAIKKLLTPNIVQYREDFDREIRILAKARHANVMPIRGYYWTPQLQLLISEFAPHGSLQTRLHEPSEEPLPWASRFKIALGIAQGIAHLHQSHRPPIVHYNIKPSNVLLDKRCSARISDFGLARLVPKLKKHITSGRFQGAMGYVAPELACQSPGANEKCDVYSYGVVVLELVTGRKPVECGEDDVMILIDTVRAMLEQGNALDCVDSRMGGRFPEEEVMPVLKLGLVCTSQIPSSRPTMAEVVQILQVINTPTAAEEDMDDF